MNNCLSAGVTMNLLYVTIYLLSILGAIFLGIFIAVVTDARIRSETKSNREYQRLKNAFYE